MRYLSVLMLLFPVLGTAQAEPTERIQGIFFFVAMAATCQSNNDQEAIRFAQSALDLEGYDELSAQDAYNAVVAGEAASSSTSPDLACRMLDALRAELTVQ